jgi:hypothetical protein
MFRDEGGTSKPTELIALETPFFFTIEGAPLTLEESLKDIHNVNFFEEGKMGNLIRKQLVYLPTIFPPLIDKIGFFMIITITERMSRFANLLKLLTTFYQFVISGLAVQIRPWAPSLLPC